MMLQKMRHAEEPEQEKVDSCVKLLDLEVAKKRRRRNSIPFFLPSLHDITYSLSNLRLGSNTKSPFIPRRNSIIREGMLPVINLLNEHPTLTSSSKYKTKDTERVKENLKCLTDEQKDEFYTTWKRIQGSRIDLAQ